MAAVGVVSGAGAKVVGAAGVVAGAGPVDDPGVEALGASAGVDAKAVSLMLF